MENAENTQTSAVRVLIVDGHALAYRMFHALPEMRSPAGAPANAIFGFIKNVRRAIQALRPTHGAVVWDGGLNRERLALLPDYKGQRPPMPDDLRSQLTPIQQWVPLAGWKCLREDGVEADDIIGTLARKCEREGAEVLVMSPDKDFMQLVSERVHLWRLCGGSEERVTPAAVQRKTGVRPDQIVDWLSLIGDASDNIAGAPGVGPKTAARLLVDYGTMCAIFDNIGQVKPERLQAVLRDSRELLERNRKLVELTMQPQYELPLEELRLRASDTGNEEKFLGEWGFNSLRRNEPQEPPMIQAELF